MATNLTQLLIANYIYLGYENSADEHDLLVTNDVARQMIADMQPVPAVETWLAESTPNFMLALHYSCMYWQIAYNGNPESTLPNGVPAIVVAFVQAFVQELDPLP